MGSIVMPKILHLTLKKKWFDLIASGEKKHEYREGKEYWKKRLLDRDGFAIEFDEVYFRNGYKKDAPFMRVEWKHLSTIYGGNWPGDHGEIANDGDFVIDLGDVLEVRANNDNYILSRCGFTAGQVTADTL